MKHPKLKTAALLFILALTHNMATIRAQCTFGNYPPPYNTNSGYTNNFLLGTKHTLTTSFLLTGLAYQGNNTGSGIQMALYNDNAGTAGTLIAYTGTTSTVGAGNNTISVITPTLLPAGVYWIMALYNQTANHVPKSITATNTVCYVALTYGAALPNTASWLTYTGQDFNYWAVSNGLSTSPSTAICQGGAVTLTATGATSYTWSTGAFTSSIAVSPTVTTSYTLNGSGQACGGVPAIINVSVNPVPTVGISGNPTVCAGNFGTLTASGANNYTWSTNSTATQVLIYPTVTATYSLTGNSAGCTNTAVHTITLLPAPTLTVSGTMSLCAGTPVLLTAVGSGTAYAWSTGATSNTVSLNPPVNTTYTVTATGANNCSYVSLVNLTVSPLPVVTVNSGSICAGRSFTLNPGGADIYSFPGGGPVVSPPSTITFTVIGTNTLSGCSNKAVANVLVSPLPVVTGNNGNICIGNSFTINPTGANTYTLAGGNYVVTPTTTTTYSLAGTDNSGCESLPVNCTVQVNPLPVIVITPNSPVVCKGETATLSASGGSTYLWNNGATASLIITPKLNISTTYTVTGIDANGCANKSVLTQSVNNCVGINSSTQATPQINVYPNPNNGLFTIEHAAPANISVYNALGQLILNENSSASKTEMDLKKFPAAIYILQVQVDKQSYVLRVVKE